MCCVLFRLSSVDVVVSLVLLAAQRLRSPLHPDWPRALQHRRGDWILCHHQDLLVVPHHGQHTRKCTHTHITQLKLIVESINLQGELGVVGCCLLISSPVISCYFFPCVSAQALRQAPNNYLSRTWWNPVFNFLEKNVQSPVPLVFSWPITLPSSCRQRYRIVEGGRDE